MNRKDHQMIQVSEFKDSHSIRNILTENMGAKHTTKEIIEEEYQAYQMQHLENKLEQEIEHVTKIIQRVEEKDMIIERKNEQLADANSMIERQRREID
jgi:hypothetical protein